MAKNLINKNLEVINRMIRDIHFQLIEIDLNPDTRDYSDGWACCYKDISSDKRKVLFELLTEFEELSNRLIDETS